MLTTVNEEIILKPFRLKIVKENSFLITSTNICDGTISRHHKMHNIINGLSDTKVYLRSTIFLALSILASCTKQDTVGLTQDQLLGVNITDTLLVETSTMLLDSLPTAAKGVLLTGTIDDAELGRIQATSYFQIQPAELSGLSLPDDAMLDSARLKLQYSGYYYGDTTVSQTISVHQISKRLSIAKLPGYLEPEESSVFSSSATFYNLSKPAMHDEPLASLTIKPRPASGDSLLLKLDPNLGSELFKMIRNNDTRISNTEEFLNYFKGIALQATGNSVTGFKDSAQVKLYYSYTGSDGLRKRNELLFKIYDTNYQFNSFSADRSQTALKSLSLRNKIIPASATNNKTYIQGGIGLVTKIAIPSIAYLSGNDHVSINKAELLVQSTSGSDTPFALPRQLSLLLANSNNVPISILTDQSGNNISIPLSLRSDGIAKASYSAPLTNFIGNYLKSYNKTSLLLSLPVEELEKSLTRLELGSQDHLSSKIKLIITYTKF
ncbi:MAG: DUF4270 family protein [Arcticibacter sp.]